MPYITPDSTPTQTKCWRISIPDDEFILAAVLGQLLELTEAENWEENGGLTEQEAADICDVFFEQFSVGRYCMIGSLVHYISINPPPDVLDCDGTQYLRINYPDLYAVLPASLIVDADNFITPTIQDAFLLAAGITYSPEDEGGAEAHTLVVSEMPSHNHNYNFPTISLDMRSVGVPNLESASTPPIVLPTTSAGGDGSHNNMPPYYAAKVGIVAK